MSRLHAVPSPIVLLLVVLLALAAAIPLQAQQAGFPDQSSLGTVTSPIDASGMAGCAVALPSLEPASTLSNPGQLGFFSLGHSFGISTSRNYAGWGADIPFNSNRTTALNLGVNLDSLMSLPFPVSLGIGYSQTALDFLQTQNFSVGLGIDYYVRLGVGLTFRRYTSGELVLFEDRYNGPVSRGLEVIDGSGTDAGLLLAVPVTTILRSLTGCKLEPLPGLRPALDISAGYAETFSGFPDPGLGFPKRAAAALAAEASLMTVSAGSDWKFLSIRFSQQAEEPTARGFASKISLFNHVVSGLDSREDLLVVRTGWEVGIGEIFTLRGGIIRDPTAEHAIPAQTLRDPFGVIMLRGMRGTASGYTIALGGLYKLLAWASPDVASDLTAAFLGNHFDILYHHSAYDKDQWWSLSKMHADALELVVRGIPWK